jgi:hypothetical protein
MATYNGARYIAEQLESFTRQTAIPSELVITDDGSTDDTLDIIDLFAARAPFPVRVERNVKRLGYRANFMKAGFVQIGINRFLRSGRCLASGKNWKPALRLSPMTSCLPITTCHGSKLNQPTKVEMTQPVEPA